MADLGSINKKMDAFNPEFFKDKSDQKKEEKELEIKESHNVNLDAMNIFGDAGNFRQKPKEIVKSKDGTLQKRQESSFQNEFVDLPTIDKTSAGASQSSLSSAQQNCIQFATGGRQQVTDSEQSDQQVIKPWQPPRIPRQAIPLAQQTPQRQIQSVQQSRPVQQQVQQSQPVQQQRKYFPHREASVKQVQQEQPLNPQTQQKQKQSSIMVKIGTPSFIQVNSDTIKFDILKKKFESGRLVLAMEHTDIEPKPVMYLLQVERELMAFKYLKSDLNVKIPATVCGLPVRYLHPDFIRGGLNPLNGLKFQNMMSNFDVENVAGLTKESFKKSLKGAKSIELPNTLTSLPPGVFGYCLALKEIVIPASITAISCRAFEFSCFKDIYFEGSCPVGFKLNRSLPKGVNIHFRKEFANSFTG